MTAVFVLRHPQTTWNEQSRYQGRLESPLSQEGERQADLAAAAFAGVRLDEVVSSPLRRTRELAERIACRTGAPLRVDQRWTEFGQGAWEGLFVGEIRQRFPEIYHQWYDNPERVRFPHGESLQEARMRAVSAFADVLARYPNGAVAIVTHSVMIEVLVCEAVGLGLHAIHRFHIGNAGVTTFCGDRLQGSLFSLNNTDAQHATPFRAAECEDCVSWNRRRTT